MEIPRDVADDAGVPDDLDSSALPPYSVPNTNRRRRAGLYYVGGAVLIGLGVAAGLPPALLVVAGVIASIGAYHFVSAWNLSVGDAQALFLANKATSFPVGHASAALGFQGWRAEPVWNVLVFSAESPPSRRGLVRIDGRTGDVVDTYIEELPAAVA